MITSYETGAVFRLMDEASPVMRQISERLTALEKLINRVSGAMKGIGDVKVGALGGGLQGIDEKLKLIGEKALGIGSKITQGMQGADDAIVGTGRLIQGIDTALGGLGKASEVGANGIVANLGRADSAIESAVGKAQSLSSELRSAATASREIGRLPGRSGGGGGGHVRPGSPSASGGDHGNTFGRHGVGVDAGIFGFMGFETVKSGIEATLHRGMELSHVQEQMRQAGFKDPDIDRATSAAWKESRTYGLDVSKTLGDIKELALPFGSVDHAIEFIEPLEKMRVVLNSVQEGRGNSSAEAVYKMARAGELKGLQNPEDFVSYFEGMTKAISASGGKITPDSFMQATKYGKLSSFGLSEDFYTRSLPTMIQTMGASTAGQSLQSLFGTLSGSVSQKSFYKIQDLGLIGDPSKIVQTKTGIQMQPGAVKGYDEFVSNPLAWAKDILVPLLEKKFGDISDPKNKEAVLGELQGMFGNRNSAAAIAELALRSKSFDKDAALIDQARGLGGADALLKHDPTAAMNNFSSAWSNLLTALSGSAVKPAVDVINALSTGLNKAGEFMQAHPDLGKALEGTLAGLVVGLGALAAVGLAAFAPGGIVAVALVTLTSALVGMMAINWDKISADFKRLNDFGNQVGDAIANFVKSIIDKVSSILPTPGNSSKMPDNPLLGPTAFHSNDNYGGPLVDTLAMGVFKGLQMYASGGGATGGVGGGSGIINASYGGDGFGGGGPGSFVPSRGGPLPGAAATGEHADFIRATAARLEIDPRVAVAVAKSEGLGASWAGGDHGTSFGDFQMHFGGSGIRGMNAGGLGDLFNRETGLDARDPKNWRAVDEWALKWAAKHGWGDWHGAARVGIGRRQGIGTYHGDIPTVSGPPPRKVSPGGPASAGPLTTAMNVPPIHAHIYVGGKKIHHEIVKQFAQSGRFPTTGGGVDGHSHYSNAAGTPVTDAA